MPFSQSASHQYSFLVVGVFTRYLKFSSRSIFPLGRICRHSLFHNLTSACKFVAMPSRYFPSSEQVELLLDVNSFVKCDKRRVSSTISLHWKFVNILRRNELQAMSSSSKGVCTNFHMFVQLRIGDGHQ